MASAPVLYNAWGGVQSGSGALTLFGFTGELERGGLTYLRARWYNPSRAGFVSRDPWAGDAETPYSFNPYQYGYSNPVSNTDPTGWCAEAGQGDDYCHDTPSPRPRGTPTPTPTGTRSPTPTPGPVVPRPGAEPVNVTRREAPRRAADAARGNSPIDVGFLVGISGTLAAGPGGQSGVEIVYDLYDFEVAVFSGRAAAGTFNVGCSISGYIGFVTGWQNQRQPDIGSGFIDFYGGPGAAASTGISVGPASVDVGLSVGQQALMSGGTIGGTFGFGKGMEQLELPDTASRWLQTVASSSASVGASDIIPQTRVTFHSGANRRPTRADAVNFKRFLSMSIPLAGNSLSSLRGIMMNIVTYNGDRWEEQRR